MKLRMRNLAAVFLLGATHCLSAAVVAAPPESHQLTARTTSLGTFCKRFSTACSATAVCADPSTAVSICEKGSADGNFDFGCTCGAKSVTDSALQKVTGLIDEKEVTKVSTRTVKSTIRSVKRTTTTPVVLKSVQRTETIYTTTVSSTVSAYQPDAYFGGDNVRRASPSSIFCSAYSSSCKTQCKAASSSVAANACARVSTGPKSDVYALECTCGKKSFTQAALAGVGGKDVQPTSTSIFTHRSTSTKVVKTTRVSSFTVTAPTSTSQVSHTVTKSAATTSISTVLLSATGRVRVDSLQPSPGVLGYISSQFTNPDEAPGIYVRVERSDPTLAASVTMELQGVPPENVYAIKWPRSSGAALYANQNILGGGELGNPSDCGAATTTSWNWRAIPYGPASTTDDQPQETYTYTLGASSVPNTVNPDRVVQRALLPLYKHSNGSVVRPYPAYHLDAGGLLFWANQPQTVCSTRFQGSLDVQFWFEPNLSS